MRILSGATGNKTMHHVGRKYHATINSTNVSPKGDRDFEADAKIFEYEDNKFFSCLSIYVQVVSTTYKKNLVTQKTLTDLTEAHSYLL